MAPYSLITVSLFLSYLSLFYSPHMATTIYQVIGFRLVHYGLDAYQTLLKLLIGTFNVLNGLVYRLMLNSISNSSNIVGF